MPAITPIKVYNNLTKSKSLFKTIEPGKVKFYSCGPTTYDLLHVGNARALVVGDIFFRIFKSLGYEVNFVRNFTDVDDKIIQRAALMGVSVLDFSEKFVAECKKDMLALGMLDPTHSPKVSETMPEIIQMIEALIERDFAYEVNGEVLYHVPKFKDSYGKLSGKDLESLQHGVRVAVEDHKKHPSDFVLWKPAKSVDELSWDSPWGKGRPGWHIECSAMSKKFLGNTIDLHHGGVDLIFPHHENEIAQSEAANGKTFCHHWCHNEFLNFGDIKMSKSLGNVVTIRAFCETFGGAILRQILVSVHYKTVMNWSQEAIQRAISEVVRIHEFTAQFEKWYGGIIEGGVNSRIDEILGRKASSEKEREAISWAEKVPSKIKKELANDFNIPAALAHFFSTIRMINREYIQKKQRPTPELLEALQKVIGLIKNATGLIYDNPKSILEVCKNANKALNEKNADADEDAGAKAGASLSEDEILLLIEKRKAARASKNWAMADEVRDQLKASHVIIKDNGDGTVTWTYGKK